MKIAKMDKNEKRAVIKFLHMKGLSPQQIHENMKEVLAMSLHKQLSIDGSPS